MIGFLKISKEDFISSFGVKDFECLYINFASIKEIRQCKDYCEIMYATDKMITVKGNFDNLYKSYFSTKSQKALEESKLLEKQVDALIAGRNKREEERINPTLF